MKLIGYIRVSTDDQAQGLSPQTQEARIRAWCEAMDAELVGIWCDNGISGTIRAESRPKFSKALSNLERGHADGIVALRLDRLSRNVRDLLGLVERFRKHDWRLVSVQESLDTDSATGRFTLTILAALAQLESETIGERTRVALAEVKRQGRARSRFIPYGWRTASGGTEAKNGDHAMLVEDATEQAVLHQMRVRRHEGWSYADIATALNGHIRMRSGRPWSRQAVRGILTRDE